LNVDKPCTGCKFLRYPFCAAVDSTLSYYQHDPLIGADVYRPGTRPYIRAMRAPGGECGPERALYRPSWWRRVFHFLLVP
jgi:hypothetical protein